MGFGGAGGRLIELGQRQRRAQVEAARALPPRDGEGGPKASSAGAGSWDRASAGVRREPGAVRRRMRDGPIRSEVASASSRIATARSEIARAGFGLGEPNLHEPVEDREHSGRAEARRRGACPRALPGRAAHGLPQASRNRRRLDTSVRSCSRTSRASSTAFGAAREGRRASDSNIAASIAESARADMRQAGDPLVMRSTSEVARATSPSAHGANAR